MQTNSKNYNQDLGSSFRKSSYYSSQNKPRAQEVDRWDHAGYDQLQLENQLRTSEPVSSRRTYNDAQTTKDAQYNKKVYTTASEKQASQQTEASKPDIQDQDQQSKPRKTKRPDRALYSVRQKHMRNEELKKQTEATAQPEKLSSNNQGKNDGSQAEKETVKVLIDKELEDDKLSISNVSTAMSDPLKSWEEESYSKNELRDKSDSLSLAPCHKNKEDVDILFEIQVEGENGLVNQCICKGDDYATILERLCFQQSLDARTALYFKINVFETIKEMLAGVDCEKLVADLDSLLDINYKLFMYENGLGEADESIAIYLEENNQYNNCNFLESFDDSTDE